MQIQLLHYHHKFFIIILLFLRLIPDVSESQSDLTGGVQDNFVADSLSQGITFRDPETGVLYVQTQLLQVRRLLFHELHFVCASPIGNTSTKKFYRTLSRNRQKCRLLEMVINDYFDLPMISSTLKKTITMTNYANTSVCDIQVYQVTPPFSCRNTWVYFSAPKHRLWVLVGTASTR